VAGRSRTPPPTSSHPVFCRSSKQSEELAQPRSKRSRGRSTNAAFGPREARAGTPQSGGHVKIYSEIGQGTTIKIYLPRMQGRVEEEENETGGLVGAEESESILLVEDDTDVRAYLAEVLRSLDYRVTTVSNVEAALAVLAQKDRKIDLLLTDIVMPEGNGRELAKAAEKMRPDIQVLYMTGYSRNAVVHQGRLDEGVDLLQKPVSQAQLAMRVRIALDRRRR
jgi:CheY-like chemotaxis protein